MVRAPCCEKMGLKKGPWKAEEDQTLVAYIHRHGHGNWRALPKQAGLLRCGKSCRLRWTNYLRPDIKRGNFTKEEEETIITLHELLGNRWSVIAARLPGRTDNEIKNVWHTHLKKRVKPSPESQEQKRKAAQSDASSSPEMEPKPILTLQINPSTANYRFEDRNLVHASPSQQSCSEEFSSSATADSSTVTSSENNNASVKEECTDSSDKFSEIDENFWSEALSLDNNTTTSMEFTESAGSLPFISSLEGPFCMNDSCNDEEDMDYWLRVSMELPELREYMMN